MKSREFERQVIGWMRGFGHDWVAWTPLPYPMDSSAHGRPRTRYTECRLCGATINVVRDGLVNVIVPAAACPLFGRLIEWKPRDGFPGVRDSRIPRMFRALSSSCSDIRSLMAVEHVLRS